MLDVNSGWGRSGLHPRRTPGTALLRLFGERECPSASAPSQSALGLRRSPLRLPGPLGQQGARGARGRDSEPGSAARLDAAAALPPVGARGTVSPPAELIYGGFKKLSPLLAAC